MLARSSRLRDAADFTATMRRGDGRARGASRSLVVHVHQRGPGSSASRVGFAVSKAVGVAVVRNRVRRRLRVLCRERLARWPGGIDIVVRALPPAAALDSVGLGADLDRAWSAAHRRLSAERETRG